MLIANKFDLEDDEEGEEDQHEEQQAAGVQRQEVVLVREVGLRSGKHGRHQIINKSHSLSIQLTSASLRLH